MAARACGSCSLAALLSPVKPSRGYHLDPLTPGLAPSGGPGREDLPGPARDHVQKPGRTTAVAHGGQVDNDGDIAVASPGVAPHRGGASRTGAKRAGQSSAPRTSTPLEPVGRLIEDLPGSGQDCVAGGVPGHPQGGCYPRHRHALQGKGPAAPTPPPSVPTRSWAQPGRSCPASTLDGSGCRSSAARVPPAAWVSTPPARRPGAGPPSRGMLPEPRRPCRTEPRSRSARGTPQRLSSRPGAAPPRSLPGRPAPGRSSDQGR